MKLLIQRMLVSTAIALVSVASAGHAMAANPHHAANLQQKAGASAAQARYQAPLDVAAIPAYPNYSSGASPGPRTGAGYDIAARSSYPQWGYGYALPVPGINVGQMIAALVGGGVPLHYSGKVTASSSSSFVDVYTPPDTSAADAVSWAAEQSANDATQAAIQQEDQNLADLDASIAAAEAQNDAAAAQVQQDMTNLVNSQ